MTGVFSLAWHLEANGGNMLSPKLEEESTRQCEGRGLSWQGWMYLLYCVVVMVLSLGIHLVPCNWDLTQDPSWAGSRMLLLVLVFFFFCWELFGSNYPWVYLDLVWLSMGSFGSGVFVLGQVFWLSQVKTLGPNHENALPKSTSEVIFADVTGELSVFQVYSESKLLNLWSKTCFSIKKTSPF